MKSFTFKENKYGLTNLIRYHYDSSLKDFNEGIVDDMSTGESFDISEIFARYKERISDLLKDSKEFSSPSEQARIKKIYENQIKGIKIVEFQSKLDDNTITLKDIEDWINLMSFKERNNFGIVKYNKFITINNAKPKPKDLAYVDYGRFFELIYIMNYENKLAYSNNSKNPIKRNVLVEKIGFKSVGSLDNFTGRLKKVGMLIKTEPNKDNISFYMINPAYAMRKMEIDFTTYTYFKSDLDDLLTLLEKKYIELKGATNRSNNMLTVLN